MAFQDIEKTVRDRIAALDAASDFHGKSSSDAAIDHFIAVAEFYDLKRHLEDAYPDSDLIVPMDAAEIRSHKAVQYDYMEDEEGSWIEYHNVELDRGANVSREGVKLMGDGWSYDFPSPKNKLTLELLKAGIAQLPKSSIREYLNFEEAEPASPETSLQL